MKKFQSYFKQVFSSEINVHKLDAYIGIYFAIVLIICGVIDKNLILLNKGKGLFQHYNIWIFIVINIFQPYLIIYFYNSLTSNLSTELHTKFKENLLTNNNLYKVLSNIVYLIGFIAFLYITLQNSGFVNQLQFDYWDSINYGLSFIVSRVYKFYLYSYYFPKIIILVLKIIFNIEKIFNIDEDKIKRYPFEEYLELNYLCNMGLNFLLSISVPLLALFSGAYFVHNTIDSTIILGGIVSFGSGIFLLFSYFKMIQNYKKSIVKYKTHHVRLINTELSNTYNSILKNKSIDSSVLEKAKYLEDVKQKIEGIDSYPLIIKAIITSLLPTLPIIVRTLLTIFKYLP